MTYQPQQLMQLTRAHTAASLCITLFECRLQSHRLDSYKYPPILLHMADCHYDNAKTITTQHNLIHTTRFDIITHSSIYCKKHHFNAIKICAALNTWYVPKVNPWNRCCGSTYCWALLGSKHGELSLVSCKSPRRELTSATPLIQAECVMTAANSASWS